MAIQEIVGAIIDGNHVSSDPCEIQASREFGHKLEYISRKRAARDPSFETLTNGPTLFVFANGVLYR